MAARSASELLFDSEASLRLVDNAIGEFTPSARDLEEMETNPFDGRARLPQTLYHAYSEMRALLERLRVSRGILEQAAMDKLAHMHDKLREVSSATEIAATDILDGLDRSVAMVDELDAAAEAPDGAVRGAEIRVRMRDELFGLMVHLQFQDITTQQLAYASSVIQDMEQRLGQLVSIFESDARPSESSPASTPSQSQEGVTFDPHASNSSATDRQALADQLFTGKH
jgi:chemotaxis regulatin CheY-phosphate phosphatase CheZ